MKDKASVTLISYSSYLSSSTSTDNESLVVRWWSLSLFCKSDQPTNPPLKPTSLFGELVPWEESTVLHTYSIQGKPVMYIYSLRCFFLRCHCISLCLLCTDITKESPSWGLCHHMIVLMYVYIFSEVLIKKWCIFSLEHQTTDWKYKCHNWLSECLLRY